MNGLEPVLKRFLEAMSTLEMGFVIVGGFAVAGWGRPRATRDIDVIIDIKEDGIAAFVKALKRRGFVVSEDDVSDALRLKEHFSIFDAGSTYHIDAKGVYGIPEERTMASRKRVTYEGTGVPISGLEDTIANKLRFGREQDLEDALSIFIVNRVRVRMTELERLCKEYGVRKELNALEKKAPRALATGKRRRAIARH